MSLRARILLSTLLLLWLAPASLGTDYYVSTSGNDGWPGSQAQPWATLQHAVDTIAAGDTIIVTPGTYVGCRMRSSGSSGAVKTLRAQTPGTVLVNSASPLARRPSNIEIIADDGSSPVEYWTIEGLEVANSLKWGIDGITAHHLTVRNCVTHNSVITGIFSAYGNYVLIENNTTYSNGEHGIYVNNSADNGVCRSNVIYSNVACGIHMNGDLSAGGDGIMSGWSIDGNVSYSNANGFDADGVELSIWKNNLSYLFTSKGIHFTCGNGAINSRSNRVFNNTLICSPTAWYPLTLIYGAGSNPMTGYRIFNNILFSYQDSAYRGSMCVSSSAFTDFQSDYNVMMGWVGIDDNAGQESLATWRNRGYDTHSVQVATTDDVNLWTNPSGADYHLKAGSAAIDAGKSTSPDVTTDKDGVTRPQGPRFDAGCYEYPSGVVAVDIATTSLPGGTIGFAYSQTLDVTGGTSPYTWSLYSGALPAGLSLDSAGGAISGSPTTVGTSNFTVRVQENGGGSDTQALSITVVALPLEITTPWLRGGWVGREWSQHLAAKQGVPPYTWAFVSGSLPSGTSLNGTTGEISGTPTSANTYTFTVRATDSQGTPMTDDAAYSVTITTGAPSGSWYYVSTTGNNAWPGTKAQPWATLQYAVDTIAAGDTIVIEPGEYVGFRIENSGSDVAPKAIMSETPWGAVLTSRELARNKHQSYAEVEKFGETVSYWILDGLQVSGNGDSRYGIDCRASSHITIRNCETHHARLTGIFVAINYYAVVENNVTYSNGEHGIYTSDSGDYGTVSGNVMHSNTALGHHMNGGLSPGYDGIMSYWTIEKNHSYSNINGFDADGVEYSVWMNNVVHDYASKGIHFTGGNGIENGAINSRYCRVLNNTIVSRPGSFFPVNVFVQTAGIPHPLGLRIFNNILYSYMDYAGRGSMCVSSYCLPDFQSDYNVVMNYFGIDDNAVIEQLATWRLRGYDVHSVQTAATSEARAALWVDADNATPALKNFHLVSGSSAIDAGTSTSPDVNFDIDGVSRPQGLYWDAGAYEYPSGKAAFQIVTTSLPGGTIDIPYSQKLVAAGGSSPYTWSIISGSLPNGLTFDAPSGTISGTPTTVQTANFRVRAVDSTQPQQADEQDLSISVTALPIEITTEWLRNWYVGVPYSQQLSAIKGVAPYTWSVVSGSLPNGTSLGSSTGLIGGTPTTAGLFTFTIRATDSQPAPYTADKTFSVEIYAYAPATTWYYVSPDGSDGGDGSIGSPWATLQKAIDTVPGGGTILVKPGNYAGFRIENNGTPAAPKTIMSETPYAANVNSKNSRVKHSSYVEVEKFGTYISYWTIDGLQVSGNGASTYGIDCRMTRHITVRNCKTHHALRTGLFAAHCYYVMLDNNITYSNGEHGIYTSDAGDYGVVRRNTMYSNTALGHHMNGGMDVGSDGIMTGWLIERNRSYTNINGYDADGVEGSVWKNNLAYDFRSKGIHFTGGTGSENGAVNSRYSRVLNNTLVCPQGGFFPLTVIVQNSSIPHPLGLRVFNNILYSYMDYAGRGTMCISSLCFPDFQSDYNVTMNWFGIDDNAVTEQIAAWRMRGYDVHSVQAAATPESRAALWVDPDNATVALRDFHLASASPAKDTGTALSDVVDDFDGISRPQGTAYDAGAYEYVVGGVGALSITTASLPNGVTNAAYQAPIAAVGGRTPYAWSIASGSLPPGIGLDPLRAQFAGEPTTAGTYNFTVRVSDAGVATVTATRALSITVVSGTSYEKTVQNGLDGYGAWQDTWITSEYPTTNYGTAVSGHLQWTTPDKQLHKFDLSGIPAGALITDARLAVYVSNNYGTAPSVGVFRVLTNWNANQATWANRLSGTPWSAAGMLAGTDYEGVAYGYKPGAGTAGWVEMPCTDLVSRWVSGTYANEGAMLQLLWNGHLYNYFADYATAANRPRLVVTYAVAGGNPVLVSTSSLPNGMVGAGYTATLAASGGVAPYTWSVVADSLPSGLTLNASTGEIAGTPTFATTSFFTVKVVDSQNPPATHRKQLAITITPAPLNINTTSLPNGVVGVAYNSTVTASGGTTPYAWSIANGTLPAGLSLDTATGAISGTPTTGQVSNFTVRVTDAVLGTDDQPLSITVTAGVQITTSSLPAGTVELAYSATMQAIGGTAPYSWSLASGSLPSGLSLNSSTGEISGTPTSAGTANFTARVDDSSNPVTYDEQALSIIVGAGGQTYYVSISGDDGWPGSLQQPWATIQHAVDAVAAGDTIIVRDGTYVGARIRYSGAAGSAKTLRAENAGLTVINAPGSLCVRPSNLEIQADTIENGVAYWVIDGIDITGSPTYGLEIQYGDHVTVKNSKVHNSAAANVVSLYGNYCSFERNEVHSATAGSGFFAGNSGDYNTFVANTSRNNSSSGLYLSSEATAAGDRIISNYVIEDNVCYSNGARFMSADGMTDSVVRNNLAYAQKKGMELLGNTAAASSRDNRILNNTVMCLALGYYSVFIHRTGAGIPEGTGNELYNNVLYNYDTATNRGSICIDTAAETDFHSDYNVVMSYFGLDDNAQILTLAQWQQRGYDVHSIQALDTALFVDPANYDFHLRSDSPARDAGTTLTDVSDDIVGVARPQGAAYDIGCYEWFAGYPDLQITTTSLVNGAVDTAYSQTLQATGGLAPYSWSVVVGSLPAGLTLASSTGVISGTPTMVETANFTVRATDSQGTPDTDDQALSIAIVPADLVVTTTSLPGGTVGVAYSQTVSAVGGVAPYSWSIVGGSLPSGLSLASSTGVIGGTPTTAQTSNFTIRVTDSQAAPDTDDQALSIVVGAAPVGTTYYVSTTGSDGWPGTEAQPWATLQHAVDTVVAGDTVIVKPGSYVGFRVSDKGGTAGSPITLKSETKGAAIINALGSVYHGSMVEFEAYSGGIGYWVVDGFDVDGTVQPHDGYRLGIDMRSMVHMTVKNCSVHDCWKTGIFPAFADYAYIVDNTTYNNGEHGIYNCNSCDYGVNRNNISHHNTGNGIQCNADVSAGGDGIMTGWLLERNTLYNNMNGFNLPGLVSSTFRNNLLYDNISKGFSIYGGEGALCANNLRILNNTLLMPLNAYFAIFMLDDMDPGPVGMRIFNNVLYHYGDAQGTGIICAATRSFSDMQSDYNVVGNWFGVDDAATTLTLAQWRATYGLDTHSIQAADTALFVNPAAKDFHLSATSPARDAGTALADVTEDLVGMSRPQNAVYDIGCYEYVVEGMHDLVITTTSLPDAVINDEYSQTLQASGGMSPYAWSIVSGSLPSGFNLDPATGIISGTPAAPETANFTVRVTDSQGVPDTDDQALTLTVSTTTLLTLQDDLDGYAGTRDTWITEDMPNDNTGTYDISHLQYPTQDRQLHKFDISMIPSGSTVNSATISFYVMDLASGTPPVNCYRVLTHWEELEATWLNRTTGVAWGVAGMLEGTDYAAAALGTATITGTGMVSFDVTGTVQGWVSGTYANEGVMYRLTGNGWARTFMREVAPEWWGHPMLEIVYTPGGGPADLQITTTSLPNGQVGLGYSQTLAATGGISPYTWSVLSGSLPAGLSLEGSTGVISGTPTTAQTANFTVRVTDSQGTPDTDDQALSITVTAADLIITTATLPNGTVGASYSQVLEAMGGLPPYAWSVVGGALPSGLSLAPSTGVISGTPTAYGASNLTVRVTDSQGAPDADDQALSITIDPADLQITTASLPNGQVGAAYSQTISATGGVTPYSWSTVGGALPGGLSLNPSTGAISGTPTAYGTSSFTVRVSDSQGTPDTDDQALSITIIPAPLMITTATLPAGQVGVDYSQTLAAVGGATPYTWSLASGSLPSGLSLNPSTGVISGTPTAYGLANFTARVSDSQNPVATDDQALSINVLPADLQITTTSLPSGQVGVAYSQALAATGGVTPYTWSVLSGSLPAGLSLNPSSGVISGTPTAPETANFTIRVADSQGTPDTDDQALSIAIAPADLAITTTTLPSGVLGSAYSQTLAATGGVTPYSWSVVSGALPAGLSLAPSTGVISGTPTTVETQNFTVRVSDSQGTPDTDDQALSIAIQAQDLVVTTTTLPAGTVNVAYSQVVNATGGVTPYTWSLAAGTLPSGLSLAPSTGVISGTPTTPGTSNFTVRVTDSQGTPDTDDQALSIMISAADLQITTTTLPNGVVSIAYSEQLAATGGVTPYAWSVLSGSLPAGLGLNPSTGEISGTPTTAQTANFTIRVTDSQGAPDTDDQALSITVVASAATYYVSTTGNDGWPGSFEQPWLTIQHAVDTIAPGDTIIVRDGTYAGFRVRTSGTSGAPKVLRAETNGAAIVNAPGPACVACNVEVRADVVENGVSYWTIRGFDVASSPSYGVYVTYGDHVTVEHMTVHGSAVAGLYMHYSNYCVVQDNEIYGVLAGSGMFMGNSGDYCEVRGNTSRNNSSGGMLVSCDGAVGGDKIMTGWLIEDNVLFSNPTRVMMLDGVELSTVRNNLGYDANKGIDLIGNSGAISSANNRVLNNTLLVNAAAGYYVAYIHRVNGALAPAVGNKLFNNILYHYNDVMGRGSVCIDQTAETGFESNYNVVMNWFAIDDNGYMLNFADWRTRGYDLNSVQAADTALFVDPAAHNYYLKSDSPARDAGTTLADVDDDIDGISRPQGSAFDIGCYEYPVYVDLAITTTSLPSGTIGTAYSQTLAASGGLTPYTWSVAAGSLPAGLSLAPSTGIISGTPTAAETANFTVQVTDSQGTPDTDTQGLSITIDAPPTPTYFFAASDSESATTSTSWQTKATVSFTPAVADDYLILAFAEYKGSSASYSTLVRLTVDGVSQSEITVEPQDTSDYQVFATAKIANLAASAHTLTVDYRSEAASATARIRNARVVAIRKASLAMFSNSADGTVALTTTATNYVTLNFTPATAGDYLLVWSAEVSAAASYSTSVEARLGGVSQDSILVESKDATDYMAFAGFQVANLAASAQTISVAAAKETGSSATHNIRRARVAAIRLTGGRFAGFQSAASDGVASTTSTTFQEKLTKSWTVPSAANWLILGNFRNLGTSGSYSVETRLQLDNVTNLTIPLREPKDTTDWLSGGCVDVRNLASGTRRVDIDYRSERNGTSVSIRAARIIAVPLD